MKVFDMSVVEAKEREIAARHPTWAAFEVRLEALRQLREESVHLDAEEKAA